MRADSPSLNLPSLAESVKENPGWLDEAVDTQEAARIIGYTKGTLATMRTTGGGPPYRKRRRRVVYIRREVFEWLAADPRSNTSELIGA